MTFNLENSLEVLHRTPAVLSTLLANLSDAWTLPNYGPDTFSPFDVVGHLIHAELTNWPIRARVILDQGSNPAFPPFDRYAMYETSKGKTMGDLLSEFAQIRAKNLDDLKALNLTNHQLNLRGLHPQFGPVTLAQLLATWTVHDLGHIHQIAKSMAYQYRDAVGPWKEFLSILPRS